MKSLKSLIILVAALWLGGCTVHVHKYSCAGNRCVQPAAQTTYQPVVHHHTVYREVPAVHQHGPNCRHTTTRAVSCRRLNKTTKRCYAQWM